MLWSAAVVFLLVESASCLKCPDGKVCSDIQTCCFTQKGYACCPYPNVGDRVYGRGEGVSVYPVIHLSDALAGCGGYGSVVRAEHFLRFVQFGDECYLFMFDNS